VHDHTGGLDILVNNIGGTEASGGGLKSWFEILPEHWAGSMQQNVVAAVRMIHAFVPAMRDRGWGRVINVASAGGTEPPPAVPDYCAAKAAVINMTVSLSKALARTGVTVSPGCTGNGRSVRASRAPGPDGGNARAPAPRPATCRRSRSAAACWRRW
jgi:3-oxoacyl-[acyl-carrier protein] reductase